MATTLPSQKDDLSSIIHSDSNIQRLSRKYNQSKQDLINDTMNKTLTEKEVQIAQRVKLWEERIVKKRFIEYWWQRSTSSVLTFE